MEFRSPWLCSAFQFVLHVSDALATLWVSLSAPALYALPSKSLLGSVPHTAQKPAVVQEGCLGASF